MKAIYSIFFLTVVTAQVLNQLRKTKQFIPTRVGYGAISECVTQEEHAYRSDSIAQRYAPAASPEAPCSTFHSGGRGVRFQQRRVHRAHNRSKLALAGIQRTACESLGELLSGYGFVETIALQSCLSCSSQGRITGGSQYR
jgi:hypothetical protein